jgi:LysM repeat protein
VQTLFRSEPLMKILKIFGLVVGIHVVAFMFVFAIPGCRSTSRHSPPPSEAVQADAAPVHAAAPTPVSDVSSPIAAADPSMTADPSSAQVSAHNDAVPALNLTTDSGGSPVVRFNPTRPGSPVSRNLQPTPAPTMTAASTYTVVSGDNLWKIAKKHGITTKEIAAANNLRPDTPLREGQKLLIPGKAIPSSTASAVPASNPAETLSYRVRSGDTLAVIARRAGTTSAAIKSLNHLKNDNVHTGQELTLPAGGAAATTLASSPEETSATMGGKNSGGVHHTVKPGETLGLIAKHYGVSRRDLAVANNIADPLKLRAGQDLVIPGKSGVGASASRAAAPADAAVPASGAIPNNAASPVSDSPIAPSPVSDASSPVAAPAAAEPTPPVIQVQDSTPTSSSK